MDAFSPKYKRDRSFYAVLAPCPNGPERADREA
jgi:hypothetical protein